MSEKKGKLNYLHEDMQVRMQNLTKQIEIYKDLQDEVSRLKKQSLTDNTALQKYNKAQNVINNELKPFNEKFNHCVVQMQQNLALLENDFKLTNGSDSSSSESVHKRRPVKARAFI